MCNVDPLLWDDFNETRIYLLAMRTGDSGILDFNVERELVRDEYDTNKNGHRPHPKRKRECTTKTERFGRLAEAQTLRELASSNKHNYNHGERYVYTSFEEGADGLAKGSDS
jgi:hypothetical protein